MRAALGFAACQSKKAQHYIAQGSALGIIVYIINNAPCKGNTLIIRLLPLQGEGGCGVYSLPRALPWAMWLLGFQPVFDHIISFTGQQ